MLLRKTRRHTVYLYYPPLHPLAFPSVSADVLAQLQRYRHLVQPETVLTTDQPSATASSSCSASSSPSPSSTPTAPSAAPSAPARPTDPHPAPPSSTPLVLPSPIGGAVVSDLASLTALWTAVLLESSVAPVDAIQPFSSSLHSLLHHLDGSTRCPPSPAPPTSSLSPASSFSSLSSPRSSILSHLHTHTSRTLRSVKFNPTLSQRVVHLHILLTLTFPTSHGPNLARLFGVLDSSVEDGGFNFLRLVVVPRFGQVERDRLLQLCEDNGYPLPVDIAQGRRQVEQEEEGEEDYGDAEQSVLPLTRPLVPIAPAAPAPPSSTSGGHGPGRSVSLISRAAPAPLPSLAFVEPALPLSVPAQLAMHRQHRMLSLLRAREDEERQRREARLKRDKRAGSTVPAGMGTGAGVGLKRPRSTDEEREAEKPLVAITRFSTGVRIHTHIGSQRGQYEGREERKGDRGGRSAGGGRGLRNSQRGARRLTFDGCAPLAPTAWLNSLTPLSSHASCTSLPTPFTTPALSSSSRSSPPNLTSTGSSSSHPHPSPFPSSSPSSSSPRSHDPACRSPQPPLPRSPYIAETPQTHQLKRSGASGSSASRTQRTGSAGDSATRVSARSAAGPSKRSLAATLRGRV